MPQNYTPVAIGRKGVPAIAERQPGKPFRGTGCRASADDRGDAGYPIGVASRAARVRGASEGTSCRSGDRGRSVT
jgi:hypothetical protein